MNLEFAVYAQVEDEEHVDRILDDLCTAMGKLGYENDPEDDSGFVKCMIVVRRTPEGVSNDEWLEDTVSGSLVMAMPVKEGTKDFLKEGNDS